MTGPETWLKPTADGLYCLPGDFHIDPVRPVARALITHGHGDHARPGHRAVLATAETLAIMRHRFGAEAGGSPQAAAYGARIDLGGVVVSFHPAGHVLGSAQIAIEHAGQRVVVSGDYKRRADPTCAAFEPVACDVFVTEATFGLPVFRHPDTALEIGKALTALRQFPDRALVIGCYPLGKTQRLLAELRRAGYDRPVWLHGALVGLTDLYRAHGHDFGDLRPASEAAGDELKGEIVLAPPCALADRWARRLPDPLPAMASGWMGVRARARQRGAELPLVISDHADWDELVATIADVGAPRLWVTHGREEALVHFARSRGIAAEALSLVGYEEED